MPKYLAGAVMLLLCSSLSFAQILEPTHTQRQEKAVTQQIKKAVNKQMAQEAIKQHQERHCYYCKNKITETGDPHLYCPALHKQRCSEKPYAQHANSGHNYTARVQNSSSEKIEIKIRLRNDGHCAACGQYIIPGLSTDPHYTCKQTGKAHSEYMIITLTADEIKKLPHCSICGGAVVDSEQLCPETQYQKVCQPTCPDCGRTAEEIAKYGHNHKPPYQF